VAREVNLRAIHPHGGDQRCAFEQLCWLLFARANVNRGIPRRREGAGGDAGLEGELVDAEGRAIVGIQAKFYADKLESTQWRNLDSSIRTALAGNASDGLLEEIVVTLPRELTLAQLQKWDAFRKAWQTEAAHLKYRKVVGFTLWGEAALLDLLLRFENRGLLLHYFEVPDFDRERCLQKTRTTIRALGDRYQPDLHTPTEAEDKLHTFLRSERCRQQFLDKAREDLRERAWLPTQKSELPQSLNEALSRAEAAWQRAQPFFGDGVSLPSSFTGLATALIESAEALMPIIEGLSALMPPRQPRSDDDYHTPQSRGPYEEVLRRFDNWEWHLRSLAGYLRGNALADQSCLLLTGDPGTGKSHLLAEVCSRYGEQGGIVLFLEGAKFSTDEPPWTQLMRWAGFPSNSARDLIETLSAMAAATSVPALICIDALNETPNRNLWRNGVLDFTAELHANDQVKLLVSCRSDYLEQTLPAALREHSVPGWAFADHHGLGVDVFEAFPKYVAAYNVRWRGLPPLVEEFRNPLFLRVFCEAYASQAPEEGSLSLGTILGHYARRKAELLGQRIDCDPSRALDALRDLAVCIQAGHGLQISEREARTICERHHAPTETSRSLYRALLSESILAEFPGPMDALGPQHLVRFTFERVWDYFISLTLLPPGGPVSESLATRLRDEDWRWQNAGLVSLLNVRFPEEGQGELCDAIALDGGIPDPDTLEQFLDSLPWRTHASFSARTVELFELATDGGLIENSLVHIVPLAPNPQHPWNADWLHQKLTAIPLAERDRTWTFWVNEQLFQLYEDSPLRELLSWAERAPMPALADEHRFLLASVLAWCASTTVVESRKRLAAAIARVIAGRTQLAVRLVRRFLSVDDPYVLERVLLAAAGAAQHASAGDVHLAELARVVHCGVFGGKTTKAHLLVRHYATEICQQAEAKGVLPPEISPQSFHPPFRSRWPRIWSEKRCEEKQKTAERADLFRSVVPDKGGPGYGNWGRYVMQGHVSQFLPQKLSEPVEAVPKGHRPRFDASVARRYVIQRVFEIGWDPQSPDNLSNVGYDGHRPKVERLSKKYQWIALYELLALLSDHYRFHDYNDSAATFQSARQLIGSELLDPFVIEPPPPQAESTWSFVRSPAPWWRGHLDLWPKPLSLEQQREAAAGPGIFHPEILFRLNDGKHDWLTLSAFHLWNEPQPVWASGRSSPFVEIETAIQSYLVRPSKATNLLRALSERDFEHHSRIWLEEPDFGQPLASLRTFPLQQDDLRLRCEIDEGWDRDWDTGACSTTCRCAPDEEQRRARDGSMPSPQLAELGNLRWLGRAFDFASPGQSTPLVCHVGKGFEGACIVRCDAMLDWLRSSDRRLVWRCFIQKYLHNQPLDQTLSRAYWSTFILLPSGEIVHFGGATCTFPHGPGPEEPLPWSETRVSKP
jgi:hypothetical protein